MNQLSAALQELASGGGHAVLVNRSYGHLVRLSSLVRPRRLYASPPRSESLQIPAYLPTTIGAWYRFSSSARTRTIRNWGWAARSPAWFRRVIAFTWWT